ncbi:hypothetical protein Baya_11835 [Bagarius yarrelli]|uniref:RPA-related protein RADX n=1 Tax=Bagarius yarrelli TaxID=175774 RepID=A0A556V1U7_BAGYA|nr:hypothetical protein Baya_11835 [Bagarius yarrelli]
MANKTTLESELFGVLEQLRSSRTLRFRPVPPLRVAVLALDRYLADARATSDSYSYDVTVTDGKWRVKCFLAPSLSRWVQVNSVRCGSCAVLELLSLVYDETRFQQGCVCIEELRFGFSDPEILLSIKDLDAVRWWAHESVGSSVDAPLRHNKKHYLALWNNEDPHGAAWRPFSPAADTVIDGDLEAILASCKKSFPLLVRVLHRSRLRYYGKPGQNIDFPFQVADQTGVMSMVLWNELCLEWYQRLVVGSVLYLQDYTLKRSYQNRSRPQLGSLPLVVFRSTEICLNPRNPSAIITVIPPKKVQPQWSLPAVTYSFSTRGEIESMSSNQACDIIGLVTYVSRVERIKNKGNAVPEKFWTHRWVHAVDGTSESPFIMEIFASSQPEIFNRISPMSYFVCTHMRVCRETSSGSGPGPVSGSGFALHLTSSTETQLYTTGCHRNQPYVSDPKVKAFIQWAKSLKDSVVLRKTMVGGYYCYPPPPLTFTPNTTISGATEGLFMAVGDLRRELDSLQYREHRRVAVQGHIAAVKYHRWPPVVLDTTPQTEHQVEHDQVGVAIDCASTSSAGAQQQSETSSVWSQNDATQSPKRRRVDQHETLGDHQDFEGSDEWPDEDDWENLSTPTDLSETGSTADSQQSITHPVASWESSVWSLLKQELTNHVRCGFLDRESVPEKFRYDDRDVILHRINLSPAKWSPNHPSDSDSDTHMPINFTGYLTLTVLGLNQQAAIDCLFLPVFCDEDPRAAGTSSGLHDDTLMSCLSTGRVCDNFSPETLLSSASALEHERVVCLLDICLLGDNRVEIICAKVYRTTDIVAPV